MRHGLNSSRNNFCFTFIFLHLSYVFREILYMAARGSIVNFFFFFFVLLKN